MSEDMSNSPQPTSIFDEIKKFYNYELAVGIKFLDPKAVLPVKAHSDDACYDVVATSKKDLGDGRIEYGLGFALEIPHNYQVDIRPRSSVHKTGMILSNCIGTGDEGYRGEYKAVFYKIIPTLPDYEVGDRIAQIQIYERKYDKIYFEEVSSFIKEDTERGEGGYGSTGK